MLSIETDILSWNLVTGSCSESEFKREEVNNDKSLIIRTVFLGCELNLFLSFSSVVFHLEFKNRIVFYHTEKVLKLFFYLMDVSSL
jgi:hypothetical protein